MKPRPSPRIRKGIKWGGLALSLLLAGVWVRSELVPEGYQGKRWDAMSILGAVQVSYIPDESARIGGVGPGYSRLPMFNGYPSVWWPDGGRDAAVGGWFCLLPFWIPLAPTLLATAAAWRLDALARRRARAGFCPKCQYNRTGLAASAVCPECGAALAHAPPPVKA